MCNSKGEVGRRERERKSFFVFSKNEESEPSPGTVHPTLPNKELWVDPVESIKHLKSSHLQGPVQLPILLIICEVSDASISCRVGKR